MIETKNTVKIVSNDEHLVIISNHTSLEELRESFSYYVPGAHFTPAFKAKRWDGKKQFITGGLNAAFAPHGLLYDIVRWFKARLYDVDWVDFRIPIPYEKLNPTMGDIILRQYQIEAVEACFEFGGGIIKLPTGAGKSAVITAVIRQNLIVNPDVLNVIIVPRSSLVLQFNDEMINEYGIDKKYIGLWGGGKKTWKSQPILITTMQSISIQTKKIGRSKVEVVRDITKKVAEYNCLMFIDECHQAACKSLIGIVNNIKPPWLFGFTGSLPEEDVPLMDIKSVMGNVLYSKKTKELMDLGFLPPMKLNVIKLKHDKFKFKKYMMDMEKAKIDERINAGLTESGDGEEEKEAKNMKYLAEIDYMSTDVFRNNVIKTIVESHTKKGENVLILVERISHGDNISAFMNGNVFLHGKDSTKVRYEIQKQCEHSKGMTIIATSGIFAMGVSIKRLHGIVLAGISSAKIGLIQAIGRGLREHESKDVLNVYDIADTSEYSSRHLRKRLKVFDNEDFAYKIMEI